jgi:hypothetical protein
MSQRCVESLLGRILTDDEFRRSFFPIGPRSFEMAAAQGLELTPVERSALSNLRARRFAFIAQTIDPRISRSSGSGGKKDSNGVSGTGSGNWGFS